MRTVASTELLVETPTTTEGGARCALAQVLLQAGTDESAVGLLGQDGLARPGSDLLLELVALLARAVRGGGKGGVVADVNDRPPVVTPPRQQLRDILLGTRVVSRPDGGVIGGIDGLLDIDD